MPAPRSVAVLAALAALAASARPAAAEPDPAAPPPRGAPGGAQAATVILDGAPTRVRWTDGDSFRVLSGPHRGRRTRLQGFNALEAYGPVHRWGGWTPAELLAVARGATRAAAAGRWTCTTGAGDDRYERLLVDCPDAALALVGAGLALAYAMEGASPAALLAAQAEARRAGAGMWAKGTPARVVTSLHAAGEPGLEAGRAYDRVVDAATGEARAVRHARRYRECEEACRGEGADRTCMVYVPYERRYRDRPACLRRAP